MTLLNTALTIILILVLFYFLKDNGINKVINDNNAYNAHACAVQGYQPDCKTPLK